jgi:hypothetical protein
MTYVYYVDGEKFTGETLNDVPSFRVSSPDENTSAYENLETGYKVWSKKGWFIHRLTGPARIFPDGREYFYLNNIYYENVKDWLKDHPNPDLYFNNIGVFAETDKVLWFLQN